MRRDALLSMTKDEIAAYAAVVGADVSACRTKEQMADEIEQRRERTADVVLLGKTFHVPMRAARDKRVTDLLAKPVISDDDAWIATVMLLGEAQASRLVEAATEADGTVDSDALGLAVARLFTSEKLKNF